MENDEMSQGTFDILWDGLFGSERNEQITTVTEMTEQDFFVEYGFELSEFDEEFDTDVSLPSVYKEQTNDSESSGKLQPENHEMDTCSDTADNFQPDSVIVDPPNLNTPPSEVSTAPEPYENVPHTSEFLDINAADVRTLIENEANKNTLRKTMSDVIKFQRFLQVKKETRDIHEIEPDLLDEYLANFILSVRKTDGEEYEPSTIRNMVSSIDRKLKRQKYAHKIIGEPSNAFQLTRDALQAKQKSLKRKGKGNKPQRSSPITDEEIDILYNKGILGGSSPKSLINTIWLNNCVMFGLRGTKENYDLRWGDVQLKTASDGLQYLELQERQTKTRSRKNINDVREVVPKIYEHDLDPERCPVQMYKLYASKRPADFSGPEDPFYIAPRTAAQPQKEYWYMKMTVGEKKIGNMLKNMAAEGGLDGNKRITNHSTRKHLVQKLRDSGVAPTDIMQISGHKNIQSVLNYSSMSEEKHKQCSKLLATTRPVPSSSTTTVTSTYTDDQNNGSISIENSEHPGFDFEPAHLAVPLGEPTTSTSTCSTVSESRTQPVSGNVHEKTVENVNIPAIPQSEMRQVNLPAINIETQKNSLTVVNDNVTMNTQLKSLFSGAVLNIQQMNIYTH